MGFEKLEVQLTNEHLAKFLNTKPVRALEELIWNALDADANEIDIIMERNELQGIESIIITDNGRGINYENVTSYFGNLGNSHKLEKKFSPGGRKYHGKQGEGRYSAFVLGENVKWYSVSEQNGQFNEFDINGDLNQLKTFEVSQPSNSFSDCTGVTVRIDNLVHENIDKLEKTYELYQSLSMTFSPYLLAYKGIKINIDGHEINPNEIIKDTMEHEISVITDTAGIIRGSLKIIEWKAGRHKNLYLCGLEDNCIDEENMSFRTSSFSHTAFLKSKVISALVEENRLEIRELDENFITLRDEALKKIKEIYRDRLANAASDEVKKIKEDNIYPYTGEAKNDVDKATRQVFDIFAYKVNEFIPEFSRTTKNSKKFTYRLLKEALESNPSSLRFILSEVLNLSSDQQNELATILEKTSLDSIINTTNLITNRVSFLYGLENILCGDEYHKRVKERSQLHKILLNELWLFGEHYTYSYDDISLKNVLKKHIELLGRNELEDQIDFSKLNDLNDIPDIGLSRQCIIGEQDHYENLVIELKRPSCVITEKEISQIKKYAYKIEDNMYFDKEKTKWKFILLGTKLDSYSKKELNQHNRAQGLVYESADSNVEVWVKEWNQVIQEAKGKYQHLKEKLELNMNDNEEGLNYLRKKYKEYLPE